MDIWDLPQNSLDDVSIDDDLHGEKINMGIAIAVPATKIIDTLNHPDLVGMRQLVEEKNLRMDYPTID